MNVGRIIKRMWYGPPHIRSAEELVTGKVEVEGTAVATGDMIISPLTSTSCVAYKYRASYTTPSRTQGTAERLLKEVEVYMPSFELKIEGGSIKVLPVSSGEFDREEHRKLQSGSLRGFNAKETLVRPGTKVKVLGTLKKEGKDGFVLHLKKIELVQEQPLSPAERSHNQKQKKKKKKKKKG